MLRMRTLRPTDVDLGSRPQGGDQQSWGQTAPGPVPTLGVVGAMGGALPSPPISWSPGCLLALLWWATLGPLEMQCQDAGGWRTRPCPGEACPQHSPESPGVAIVPLFTVGHTLVHVLVIANTQCTETGSRVSPRGTAFIKEFICREEARGVSSSYLSQDKRSLPNGWCGLVSIHHIDQGR